MYINVLEYIFVFMLYALIGGIAGGITDNWKSMTERGVRHTVFWPVYLIKWMVISIMIAAFTKD